LKSDSNLAALVNQAIIRDLYRSHQSGTGRYGNILWSLLVLARWADRYLASSVSQPIEVSSR
jgi:asparagine synthase (glutamine-hydrolysing)